MRRIFSKNSVKYFIFSQVLVVVNEVNSQRQATFDLTTFNLPIEITATRTSSSEQNYDLGRISLNNDGELSFYFPAKSVTTFVATSAVAKAVTQLLQNGDFESPTKEPWVLFFGTRVDGAINGDYVYTGDYSGYLDFTESELSLNQDVIAPESKTYYLTARVATNGPETKFGVLVNDIQGPELVVEAWHGYQVFGLSFKAQAGDKISVYLYGPKGDGTNGQIDNVFLH